MEVEYKRDMNHNYLIVKGEESELDVSSYEMHMLLTNSIQGLLGCSMQGMDSQRLFYYEITSKQSIASIFENKKLGNLQIRAILQGMVSILTDMESYLMNSAHILLDSSYMYLDAQQEKVYFCYLPMYEKSFTSSFQEWMEYLLPRINHEDQQAVRMGYGLYRRAMEDNFNLEGICQELSQKEEEPKKKSKGRYCENEISEEKEVLRQQAIEEFFEEDDVEEERFPYVLLGALLLGGVVLFGSFYLLREYRLLSTLQMQVGVGILLLLSGIAGWLYYQKQKKELELMLTVSKTPEAEKKKDKEDKKDKEEIIARELQEEDDILYGETTLLAKAGEQRKESRLQGVWPSSLETISLREGSTLIGKLEAAVDVYIPLPTISRLHSKIKKENGRDYLMDLNSKNGTFVNDRLLEGEEAYELQEGDQIRFADAIYSYHI